LSTGVICCLIQLIEPSVGQVWITVTVISRDYFSQNVFTAHMHTLR